MLKIKRNVYAKSLSRATKRYPIQATVKARFYAFYGGYPLLASDVVNIRRIARCFNEARSISIEDTIDVGWVPGRGEIPE